MGSGPDRGSSPVEWGEIPYIPSVRPSIKRVVFRTIGGILDFYIIDGTSLHEVVDEYYSLIGRPMMPPYWTLGFQLCRYGYTNDSHIRKVFDRVKDLDIPFDTQYADIDYMRDQLSFTYDPEKFAGLPELTKYVHAHVRMSL